VYSAHVVGVPQAIVGQEEPRKGIVSIMEGYVKESKPIVNDDVTTLT
jgi:hypothetical protein